MRVISTFLSLCVFINPFDILLALSLQTPAITNFSEQNDFIVSEIMLRILSVVALSLQIIASMNSLFNPLPEGLILEQPTA